MQSKFLYGSLISRIANMPTAIKKYEDLYNTESSQLNWKDIFLLPLQVTLSTKLREFQYKILNRILYTNTEDALQVQKSRVPLMLPMQSGHRDSRTLLFLLPTS